MASNMAGKGILNYQEQNDDIFDLTETCLFLSKFIC